jgi:endonuclease/exonuclease/phosphatase family metal-dependent hydrolase
MRKAAELPTLFDRTDIERRGALWVEMSIEGRKVQVINTHLGLNRQERIGILRIIL